MIISVYKGISAAEIRQCIKNAQDGHLDPVKSFFETHKRNAHIEKVSHILIADMIRVPRAYKRPLDLLEAVTEKNFDYRSFWNFCKGEDIREESIWIMPLSAADRETVQAAGILMAEYVTHAIIHEEKFSPAYVRMIKELRKNSAVDASESAALRDSILRVQHAMADYVRENKDVLPLPRAAAMLPILADTVAPDIAGLWSKKLQTVKCVERFGVTGEVVRVRPVWQPL